MHNRDRTQTVENKVIFFEASKSRHSNFSFQFLRYFSLFLFAVAVTTPFNATNFYSLVGGNPFLNSLFIALIRNLWGAGIAVIIFVCHFGGGGYVNTFLSSKYWMPIGRLGFSIYLVHPVIQFNFNSYRENPANLETTHMVSLNRSVNFAGANRMLKYIEWLLYSWSTTPRTWVCQLLQAFSFTYWSKNLFHRSARKFQGSGHPKSLWCSQHRWKKKIWMEKHFFLQILSAKKWKTSEHLTKEVGEWLDLLAWMLELKN